MDLRDLRLRSSPWIALLVGTVLVVWGVLEKGTAASWGDLYPGVAAIAAGLLLFGLLKYLDRPLGSEEPPEPDERPPAA